MLIFLEKDFWRTELQLNLSSVLVLQYDPFAEHRPPKIAEREDEYKARRRQMIISPERHDPFADGNLFYFFTFYCFPTHPINFEMPLHYSVV